MHLIQQTWLRRRHFAAIALFAMAMLQFSVADHQFDHAAGDTAESCEICAHLDRHDDAPPSVLSDSPAIHASVASADVVVGFATKSSADSARIRAPPRT